MYVIKGFILQLITFQNLLAFILSFVGLFTFFKTIHIEVRNKDRIVFGFSLE